MSDRSSKKVIRVSLKSRASSMKRTSESNFDLFHTAEIKLVEDRIKIFVKKESEILRKSEKEKLLKTSIRLIQ